MSYYGAGWAVKLHTRDTSSQSPLLSAKLEGPSGSQEARRPRYSHLMKSTLAW